MDPCPASFPTISLFFPQLRVQFSTDSRVQKMFEILLDPNSEADLLEKVRAKQQAGQQRALLGHAYAGAGAGDSSWGKVGKDGPNVKHFRK